jgi:hypothetical protein
MCRWLVDKYDVKVKAFIIKDKPLQITLIDVENIMGLPKQGREFHLIGSERTYDKIEVELLMVRF